LVNVGTRYYQDKGLSIIDFSSEEHELVIAQGSLKGNSIKTSGQRMMIEGGERPVNDLAVLQRVHDKERKRTVFMAAGTGSNGTMAATLYLVNHWEDLHRRFGRYDRESFAVVIECPNRRTAEKGYLLPPIERGEFSP
jgi:hypothetical protein